MGPIETVLATDILLLVFFPVVFYATVKKDSCTNSVEIKEIFPNKILNRNCVVSFLCALLVTIGKVAPAFGGEGGGCRLHVPTLCNVSCIGYEALGLNSHL